MSPKGHVKKHHGPEPKYKQLLLWTDVGHEAVLVNSLGDGGEKSVRRLSQAEFIRQAVGMERVAPGRGDPGER